LIRVACRDFRCLAETAFEPAPGTTLLRGANAQGKTSLFEAVLFAAVTKSHRTNQDAELVRHGCPGFHVRLDALRADREVTIDARWREGIKRFQVNGVPQTRLSDILGKIHVVLFCPEDAELVRGGAAIRRRFLDMEISQVSPPYLNALQQYRQALRQRNELLRRQESDPAMFDVWEAQLARDGATLMREREAYIQELARHGADAYARLAEQEPLALAYRPDVPDPDQLAAALVKARDTDLKRAATTRGPHRDDLDIHIADKSARLFASQGQQKTAALVLKLAELELVKARAGEYPVLMLDEVLAELDEARARRLVAAIPRETQCLVTTTELEPRPGRFGADWAEFRIERGTVQAI
ncbi:MAG TPA: DNA replication/repair protein RecF, partial [Candidatus Hydrogenedentes bacterium]|nr:DNA replication/repair protein RecF [Candidatus Hydrogenedentota bacterium]